MRGDLLGTVANLQPGMTVDMTGGRRATVVSTHTENDIVISAEMHVHGAELPTIFRFADLVTMLVPAFPTLQEVNELAMKITATRDLLALLGHGHDQLGVLEELQAGMTPSQLWHAMTAIGEVHSMLANIAMHIAKDGK